MIVLPDLSHVDPAKLQRGHIVRLAESEILSAGDAYGLVRAKKHFGGGYWRIRWDLLSLPEPGWPSTGILHVRVGLVPCVSQEQWRQMPRSPYPVRRSNEGEKP
ncbi:hypothetical protein [Streptosporangium amethystogenes]|uniref:hypothetical protein n=1 Tax=Streptosporangium amethystogenes TaxID=2002 RepID=UPI0004CA1814|nr:hypothetical protein [Streptosporangium amethystogenes]